LTPDGKTMRLYGIACLRDNCSLPGKNIAIKRPITAKNDHGLKYRTFLFISSSHTFHSRAIPQSECKRFGRGNHSFYKRIWTTFGRKSDSF